MPVLIENLAKKHYENFPVGSYFVPRKYREVIHLVYAFARVADDIADEGNLSVEDRIVCLSDWEQKLLNAVAGNSEDLFFAKLAKNISQLSLEVQLFRDLITAFRRDCYNPTYETFNEVLDYCKYSANPVGRLLLQIFHNSNEENNFHSDQICTALQLTNFWQDISIDSKRNRFYIPIEDMRKFGVKADELRSTENREQVCQLIRFEVERTHTFFENGKPLLQNIHKDFQREVTLIWHGGTRILKKIAQQNYDTRIVRPKLNFIDGTIILFRSLTA